MSMMDRLCLKLEAMCLDADKNPSLLFQEASKYVENQMSTVGSNMRKLCVEIIRDLLPPSALNASGATEADDNTVKLVEEELEQFHPHKQVQQSSTPHQHRVDHERVDNAKSDLEERRLLELAKIGDKTQQPADKKDAMSDVPLRCKAECLSDTFRELGRNVPESSEDMSSLLNTRSQPTFELYFKFVFNKEVAGNLYNFFFNGMAGALTKPHGNLDVFANVPFLKDQATTLFEIMLFVLPLLLIFLRFLWSKTGFLG